MDVHRNLQPLIDGDLLVFEIAVLGDYLDEETQEERVRDFRYLEEIIVNRIDEICKAVGSTLDPIIYITGRGNFRYDIAVTKPYKGNRDDKKPTHFENVKWFIISRYNAIIIDGMEADDALAIEQCKTLLDIGADKLYCPTVICSRDKDLKQVPGWHYGWEVGLQAEYHIRFVDPLGELHATYQETTSEKTGKELKSFKKLTGTGALWFYAQILTGDTTDNIPGLKGYGPQKAYELLKEVETEEQAFHTVLNTYKEVFGDEMEARKVMLEQARLVWMVRELNADGSPKMWEMLDGIS